TAPFWANAATAKNRNRVESSSRFILMFCVLSDFAHAKITFFPHTALRQGVNRQKKGVSRQPTPRLQQTGRFS
ncbi:hypothetical protein, partial [Bacteroides sp.]|uniref:hypothetical protein n=1 Tax=Bacteroides sp. TaxID=29523 RepID=UPI003A8DA0E1